MVIIKALLYPFHLEMISTQDHDQFKHGEKHCYLNFLSFLRCAFGADGCAQLGAKKLATPARPIWRFCSTDRQNQAVFHIELSFSPKGEAQERGLNGCDSAQRAVQVGQVTRERQCVGSQRWQLITT